MLLLLGFLLLWGVPDFTGSVNITTPEQTIQEAQGETVHLPCTFALSPEDQGPLDVEWLRLSGPDNEEVDRVPGLKVQAQSASCFNCPLLVYKCTSLHLARVPTEHSWDATYSVYRSSSELKVHLKSPGPAVLIPGNYEPGTAVTGPICRQCQWHVTMIILYTVDKIYSDFYYDLKGRVNFTTDDIVSGDASIKIRNARPSDSGTYQCKVKKAPGVAKTTIQLTVVDFTGSVNITTPEQTIQEAQGETVHLPCTFALSPEDQGPLDVEWLRLSGPDSEEVDRVVILYSADKISDDVYPDLKGRVHFTSHDIRSGDASINITNVQLSDAGTYRCRVKENPSIVNRNIKLAVTDFTGSVNITTPEQTIREAQGETVHLPCTFALGPRDQGPLFIDWIQLTGPENEEVNRMFIVNLADKIYDDFYQDMKGRVKFTSNDIRSGDASINISNVQLSDAGIYQCGVFHGSEATKRTIQLTVVG